MEKEIYYTRVLPLVRYIVKKDKNGKEYTDVIDNLSREERLSLSEEKARMLWNNGTDLYVAEQPLSYHEGMSIKFSIVYLFDELSKDLSTIPIRKIRNIMGIPNNWRRLKTLN